MNLNNASKKELRDYFGIKNITKAKNDDGFDDVNEYYKDLFYRKQTSELVKIELQRRKQLQIEEDEKDKKRKLKNKLKKLRKRINKQAKQISDSDNETEDEIEQVKPYITFSSHIEKQFTENLYLIALLNSYYENNENYRNFLLENQYEKIKVTKQLHTGFTDPLHFNGYFSTRDDSNVSNCIHFYVEDDAIKKLTMIVEIL